ncbi:hypothetical protein [Curtobacterium sp. MCPF17_021]|uniref:hypothetical protein n=1 Tax=Curtobacterium sp. MCPF17_021 TaxID=2175639 RepID=UPI000DA8FC68|nr:hypothetical protein [Curtobacterium sp. MCPF17_021]WIE83127.1 hypothetical protein DEJ29_017350 [Curtobacterium sp. MCPF17_021]
MEYVKPWLSIGEQIEKLASKGVRIGDRGVARSVLREVGYYCLTGYLYPFRWLASVNYVRNVEAHHARLFNRKLVVVPKRPRSGAVPLLAHLSGTDAPKQFGVYNTLAVMAYLLRSIPSDHDWAERVAAFLGAFPSNEHLDLSSMGVGAGWLDHAIWRGRH